MFLIHNLRKIYMEKLGISMTGLKRAVLLLLGNTSMNIYH